MSQGNSMIAQISHTLDVNQRTWLCNLSHYPYSLQATTELTVARSTSKVCRFHLKHTANLKSWTLVVLPQRGSKGHRSTGSENLRMWHAHTRHASQSTTKHSCCCLLVIRIRAQHVSLLSSAASPTGKDEHWQVPREQQPLLLFCNCFVETKFPVGPGKRPQVKKISNSRICSTAVSQCTEFSNGITGYQPAWGGSLDEPGTSPSRHQGMTQTLGNRHNKPHIHSKCINMLWELGKSRSSNRAGSCQMTTLTLLQLAMHQTP